MDEAGQFAVAHHQGAAGGGGGGLGGEQHQAGRVAWHHLLQRRPAAADQGEGFQEAVGGGVDAGGGLTVIDGQVPAPPGEIIDQGGGGRDQTCARYGRN